jgi:hypothetical protein
MSIIGVIVVLVVVGVLLWLVNAYIPMDPVIKRILNIVVIILVVLWVLNLFIPLATLGSVGTVHRLR